jgi:hypothetical protein
MLALRCFVHYLRQGDFSADDLFSCRHSGELALKNSIFLSPAPGDFPHINLFDCRHSGDQGTPQMHLFSPARGRIYFFIANLAIYRHYFEHCGGPHGGTSQDVRPEGNITCTYVAIDFGANTK